MTAPRTIGIVAITAEGASLCYRTIVAESADLLPPRVHPPVALYNPSLHLTNACLARRDWPALAALVRDAMRRLVAVGAELLIMPANAPHYAAPYFLPDCPAPFLSIVDTAVAACAERGFARVGVLGIGLTMSDGLYVRPLEERGIAPILPTAEEQAIVNRVIYDHIIPARVTPRSTRCVLDVLRRLHERGAEAVILGCTELPIVVTERNAPLPCIDTTRLLARTALLRAIQGTPELAVVTEADDAERGGAG